MKKIIFNNSKGLKLAGILYEPKNAKSAVIISHGFAATKDRGRLIDLSEALFKSGFAVLRFDFGGCGESEERDITVKDQVDDLKSAINLIKKEGYNKIGLLGESLGGLTSILAYGSAIKSIVLFAPVSRSKTPSLMKDKTIREAMEKNGFIIHQKKGKGYKVTKKYIEERNSIIQEKILARIKCPVLICHGDKDQTVPVEHSIEAIEYLSKDSKIEIIENGEHSLETKMDKVIPLSVEWFKDHL